MNTGQIVPRNRETGLRPKATPEYVAALAKTARTLHDASIAPSTRRAYQSAWRLFEEWCNDVGQAAVPAEETTLIAYVAHLDNLGVTHSTVSKHLAAIKWVHGLEDADLRTGLKLAAVTRGHARTHGRAADTRAKGMRARHVRTIAAAMDPTKTIDLRDRAIILIGFAGGFRRSELANIEVKHVEEHDDGLRIHVRRSKSDQEGRGKWKAIPYGQNEATCPVRAYWAWLNAAGISSGKVFRAVRQNGTVWGDGITDQVVARVVASRAKKAGVVNAGERWSGHSLRRGFATEATARGVPRHQIMADGGWTSSTVDVYIEEGTSFRERAASRLGL